MRTHRLPILGAVFFLAAGCGGSVVIDDVGAGGAHGASSSTGTTVSTSSSSSTSSVATSVSSGTGWGSSSTGPCAVGCGDVADPGECDCQASCGDVTRSATCKIDDPEWVVVCTCKVQGMVVGTCEGVANGLACDFDLGCCTDFF